MAKDHIRRAVTRQLPDAVKVGMQIVRMLLRQTPPKRPESHERSSGRVARHGNDHQSALTAREPSVGKAKMHQKVDPCGKGPPLTATIGEQHQSGTCLVFVRLRPVVPWSIL